MAYTVDNILFHNGVSILENIVTCLKKKILFHNYKIKKQTNSNIAKYLIKENGYV